MAVIVGVGGHGKGVAMDRRQQMAAAAERVRARAARLAQAGRRQVREPVSVGTLERMSPAQRDEVFRSSRAGDVPRGKGEGVALLPLGPVPTRVAAAVIRALIWKGKVFDPRYDGLRNRMTPFGFRLIRAKVYKDPSWVDGGECIVLDYSRTSLVAHWVRDEIREVAGRTYLGQVFVRGRKLLHFTLTFPPSA